MKALVYEGPEQLAYRDFKDPVQGADTQLIRIDSVGICGSDMHAFLGHDERRPAPLILAMKLPASLLAAPEMVNVSRLTRWCLVENAARVWRVAIIYARTGKLSRCLRARAHLPNGCLCPVKTWSVCQKEYHLKKRPWQSRLPADGMQSNWPWPPWVMTPLH